MLIKISFDKLRGNGAIIEGMVPESIISGCLLLEGLYFSEGNVI